MNEVAKIKAAESEIVPASDTATVLNLISRAASDPNCDIDKMERLLKMHGDMESRVREQEFNVAMREAQNKMRSVVRDSDNSQTHSKYASYAALDRMARPVYTAAGFALSFDSGDNAPPDCVRVVCYVSHIGGFTRRYHADMPADGKGAKGGDVMTKTHAAGSAFTYGQRYLLKMIFNLATSDKSDDDGVFASKTPIDAEQAQNLRDKIAASKTSEAKFLKWAKVGRIEDIDVSLYDSCCEAILIASKTVRSHP